MRALECKDIRQEIEETDPGQQPGALAMSHVRQCNECLQFFEQEKKLRQLVASLSPVEAPADFDFRLRARIANECVRSRHGFRAGNLSLAIPALTFAGLAVVAGVFFLMPGMRGSEEAVSSLGNVPIQNNVVETVKEGGDQSRAVEKRSVLEVQSVRPERKPSAAGKRQSLVFRQTDRMEIEDSSHFGATILRQQESFSESRIPLSFPLQTLTVSVDDGSGVSRTISIPTVSFGSQRVLTNTRSGLNQPVRSVW